MGCPAGSAMRSKSVSRWRTVQWFSSAAATFSSSVSTGRDGVRALSEAGAGDDRVVAEVGPQLRHRPQVTCCDRPGRAAGPTMTVPAQVLGPGDAQARSLLGQQAEVLRGDVGIRAGGIKHLQQALEKSSDRTGRVRRPPQRGARTRCACSA